MAVVWGTKLDRSTGAMTEDDIVAFCYAKAGWQKSHATTKAFERAAQYMLAYQGKNGGTVYHFDGKMVRHTTENCGEATVFFTYGAGICSVVGIGEHSGPNNKTATYTLAWHSQSWTVRNTSGLVTKKVDLDNYHDPSPNVRPQSTRKSVLRRH